MLSYFDNISFYDGSYFLSDELNQDFFTKMYAEYEKVCQECLDQAERAKVLL